jgi:transposase InsO family protein
VVCGRSYPRIFRFLLNPTGLLQLYRPRPFVDPIGEAFFNILLGKRTSLQVRSRQKAERALEEGVWLHNFGSFTEARTAIAKWIEWYNVGRPHQSLGYRSPRQFRALHPQLLA